MTKISSNVENRLNAVTRKMIGVVREMVESELATINSRLDGIDIEISSLCDGESAFVKRLDALSERLDKLEGKQTPQPERTWTLDDVEQWAEIFEDYECGQIDRDNQRELGQMLRRLIELEERSAIRSGMPSTSRATT